MGVEKKKLGKERRLQITMAIETILETQCRPCETRGDSTVHTKPQCLACVHYKALRQLGNALGTEDKEKLFTDKQLADARANGVTESQMISRYRRGVPMAQITAKRVQVSHNWTEEEDRKLLELQELGATLREMTEILNRSFAPIEKRLRFLRSS